MAENRGHQLLLKDIQALLHECNKVWLSFCYREANRIADLLSKFGKGNIYLYKTFLTPNFLLEVVSDDMYGKYENRIIGGIRINLISLSNLFSFSVKIKIYLISSKLHSL